MPRRTTRPYSESTDSRHWTNARIGGCRENLFVIFIGLVLIVACADHLTGGAIL